MSLEFQVFATLARKVKVAEDALAKDYTTTNRLRATQAREQLLLNLEACAPRKMAMQTEGMARP